MSGRYEVRSELWLDPDNDPKEPKLLFAKKVFDLFEDLPAVHFTKDNPRPLSSNDFSATSDRKSVV